MSDNVLIAIIAVSGVAFSAVCVLAAAIFGFTSNNKRLDDIKSTLSKLDDSFNAFKEVVNGKLQAIDNEISVLLDRKP